MTMPLYMKILVIEPNGFLHSLDGGRTSKQFEPSKEYVVPYIEGVTICRAGWALDVTHFRIVTILAFLAIGAWLIMRHSVGRALRVLAKWLMRAADWIEWEGFTD